MENYFDSEDYINFDGEEYFVSSIPLDDFQHTKTGNYELFTKFYQPKEGDVVFDIGAGMGEEITRFSKIVGESGLVVAIEAHPIAFRRLVKLVKVSNFTNVICLNYAITDDNFSKAFFNLNEDYSLSANIYKSFTQDSVGISTRRLDSIMRQYSISRINFLKMNIEGAEISAIIGLGREISCIKNICVSCHDFLQTPESKTHEKVLLLLKEKYVLCGNEFSDIFSWQNFYVYGQRQP